MMMKKMLAMMMMLILLVGVGTGCSSSEEKERVDATGTAKVEAMLLAFNEGDFESFSKDFGPMMTAAMNQAAFEDQLKPAISGLIGDYEAGSLTLAKVTKQTNKGVDYIAAIYRSTFTNEEGDVTVSIWFTDDEEMKIETLVLNSPKLVKGNG